jgi:hypothetical protein
MDKLRQDNLVLREEFDTARKASLSGVTPVGAMNGHHGQYLDFTIKFIDKSGKPFEFKSVPHVVAAADRGGAEDQVS